MRAHGLQSVYDEYDFWSSRQLLCNLTLPLLQQLLSCFCLTISRTLYPTLSTFIKRLLTPSNTSTEHLSFLVKTRCINPLLERNAAIIHAYTSTLSRNHAYTHTHPFNGPFSGTTRVSRYQKGKTNSVKALKAAIALLKYNKAKCKWISSSSSQTFLKWPKQ